MNPGWEVAVPAGAVSDLERDEAVEVVAARLWRSGAVSVTIGRDGSVRGVFDHPRPLDDSWRLGGPAWTQLNGDHMAAWHETSRPVRAGAFFVVPSHRARDHMPAGADHRIVLDAGMAFGTGHHETTAGCLEALSDLPVEGRRVVDVGTGSGVLAIAAARLGAHHVAAVDLDSTAVQVARANCRDNDVNVAVAAGSTDLLLRARDHPPAAPALAGPWDVVLANLLTGTLIDLARDLYELTAPDGVLVASGASVANAQAVVAALSEAGFVETVVRPATEWVVLVARRRSAQVSREAAPRRGTGDTAGRP